MVTRPMTSRDLERSRCYPIGLEFNIAKTVGDVVTQYGRLSQRQLGLLFSRPYKNTSVRAALHDYTPNSQQHQLSSLSTRTLQANSCATHYRRLILHRCKHVKLGLFKTSNGQYVATTTACIPRLHHGAHLKINSTSVYSILFQRTTLSTLWLSLVRVFVCIS